MFTWPKMIAVLAAAGIGVMTYFFVQSIETYDYIVETNAFFAPFEYYDNRKIVGVDVDIINRVAEKLNAKIQSFVLPCTFAFCIFAYVFSIINNLYFVPVCP